MIIKYIHHFKQIFSILSCFIIYVNKESAFHYFFGPTLRICFPEVVFLRQPRLHLLMAAKLGGTGFEGSQELQRSAKAWKHQGGLEFLKANQDRLSVKVKLICSRKHPSFCSCQYYGRTNKNSISLGEELAWEVEKNLCRL